MGLFSRSDSTGDGTFSKRERNHQKLEDQNAKAAIAKKARFAIEEAGRRDAKRRNEDKKAAGGKGKYARNQRNNRREY